MWKSPPGKLELTLIYSDAGWPLIHTTGITSNDLFKDKDRLTFIEGRDTRTISPEDLTHMVNQECNHGRRLTLFRGSGSGGSSSKNDE